MNHKNRYKILKMFSNIYINFKTGLVFTSNFELLISVMLSAQTTDRMVNKTTQRLFGIANTPSGFISIGLHAIRENIRKLGLYNKKSSNILRTCEILLKRYGGKVPNNREDLESLPGVGRKTANVILNVIFKKKTIAVDTHVFRLCNRIGFAKGTTVLTVEKKLLNIVPEKFKLNFHAWFIMHGRYICTSRVPKCSKCIISSLCEFKDKNI
ncbi:endonuclease III [Buchnera aphidicola]|uniref:endonuclease III n=1 Tax=Buchnera aphidicola TaxID=9 RepID=UPI00031DED0E|nr:endonuclease III [Buchnera aphidicola]